MTAHGKKLLALLFTAIRGVLSTISSIALAFANPASAHTPGRQPNDHSPLLLQSPSAQATIGRMVEAIKAAAGGPLTPGNAQSAIREAAAAMPDATPDMVIAAIDRLKLSDAALRESILATQRVYGLREHDAITSLLSDCFMTQGRDAAASCAIRLRAIYGDHAINQALENVPNAFLSDGTKLSEIEPASGGVYDG